VIHTGRNASSASYICGDRMSKTSKYRLCLWSIGITVGIAIVNIAAKEYEPMWQPSSVVGRINGLGGLAVLVSFGLALAALFKNEPALAGLLAFFLSLFSFLLYLR
jgi:hypothetical protein